MKESLSFYKVIMNDKDYYLTWPGDQTPPPGWRDIGQHGTKDECLAYINRQASAGPQAPDSPGEMQEAIKTYVAPRTTFEKILAEIWAGVLQVERVGVEDNFFDMQGDSILLAVVHSEIQERLNRDVPLLALFEYPTIRMLAQYLEQGCDTSMPVPDDQWREKLETGKKRLEQQLRQRETL